MDNLLGFSYEGGVIQMRLDANNHDGTPGMWPLFEFDDLDQPQPVRMKAILGYVEHLNGDFYRIYDSAGDEITIIDRRGLLIRAIQKESEVLLKDLWGLGLND